MEQKKSTQKRHQLLNAALDVFSLYGFSGASLDEIAQIAEMQRLRTAFSGVETALRDQFVQQSSAAAQALRGSARGLKQSVGVFTL